MSEKNLQNPSDEQISAWKKQYKSVYRLCIDGKNAFLKNPDRKTLSLAMQRIAKGDIMGGSEAVLENCWLGGDPEIKEDDELFMSAVGKIGDLLQVKEAELEKL